jgi:hypothetical protein
MRKSTRSRQSCLSERGLAAARGPDNRYKATVRQSPCEPPNIVFASEEKVLLASLEPFKTPIGSGLIGQFVAIRLDCLSLYPRNQPLESAQVIESRPKIDPGTLLQERIERFGACSWQQDRYNPEIVPASRSLVQENLSSPQCAKLPLPCGPKKIAAVELCSMARSSSGCQGSPGTRCHLSRNGSSPASL